MLIRRILSGAVLALSLSAAPVAAEHPISRQVRAGDGFFPIKLSIIGTPDAYEGIMAILSRGGKIEICGVGRYKTAQFRSWVYQTLLHAKLKMNGQTILRDFNFFATVKRTEALEGAMANCVMTGTAAPRGKPKFDIDWPNISPRS